MTHDIPIGAFGEPVLLPDGSEPMAQVEPVFSEDPYAGPQDPLAWRFTFDERDVGGLEEGDYLITANLRLYRVGPALHGAGAVIYLCKQVPV